MFALAKSIFNTVLGRKRALDDEDDHEQVQQVETKKQKLDIIHRVRVTNLPEREISTVKKYFTGLGYKRIKKAPEWDFAYIAIDVSVFYSKCQHHVTRVHSSLLTFFF
jgi:tRNA (uracil-5-)-methyltransferase